MGYVIPIIIFLIDFKQNQIPLFKKKLIPISIIIIICLSLRIFILDSLIGGYGENIHLNVNLNTVLKSIVAYFIKYFTFYRFSNSIFISLLVLTSIGLISIPLLKNLYIEKNFKKLFFITALFITTILPVINLEITSFHSIQSDRYGYFNTVVFAIILSQIICSWNKSKIIILSTVIISLFSILTFYDTKKWVVASEICNQYLKELITHEIENKNILILNIPDNYKGAYVLRNGINEYLNLNNINGNISLINYQSFNSQISGIKLNGSELLNVESDLIKTDSIVLKALLLDSIKYDFILYYQDKSFKKLNPESRLLLKKYFN
jgi:hypothetical protein